MSPRFLNVLRSCVAVSAMAAMLITLGCSESVTDADGDRVAPGPIVTASTVVAGPVINDCERLALEANSAAKAYRRATRELVIAVGQGVDTEVTAAARQNAIVAFDQLRALQEAMANACRPPSIDGTWTLNPPLEVSCPFIPLGFGDIRVGSVRMTRVSPNEVLMLFPVQLGMIPGTFDVEVAVPYDAVTGGIDGASDFSFDDGVNASGNGTIAFAGAFTSPETFEGHIVMSLYVSVAYSVFAFSGQCDDVDVTFTATRTGN